MATANTKASALDELAPLNAEAFKTRRTGSGRKATVLAEDILAKVSELVKANNGMQSNKFYTSDSAQCEAYNAKRASAAKTRGAEAPAALTVLGHAERLARTAAGKYLPYVERVADELDKATSVRVRNEGTNDHPQMRWGIVLVNHRKREPKAS